MAIVLAVRKGNYERIPFVHWLDGQCRLRVDGTWHDVTSRDQIVALLLHAGYEDIRAPEIIALQ